MHSQGIELLKAWIDRRGFDTQSAAAAFLGLSPSQLSMFLNGHRSPTRDQAATIEDLTGIRVRSWSLSADDKSLQPVGAGAAKSRHHKA